MARFGMAVALVAIGVAALSVAPMGQSCITDVDSHVCETGGAIVLNMVGAASIAGGIIWSGLLWSRRHFTTT